MQRAPTVPTRGGLPVPLLGLVGRACGGLVVAGLPGPPVTVRASRYAASRWPRSAAGPASTARTRCRTAVFQQVGERVGAQYVALFRGLAQPVLGGGLVPALAEVPAQRVRGGGGSGDGGDAPPSGGLVGVSALVQQHAQVVGGGPVAGRGGGTQVGLGSVEVAAAQQHRAEHAHRLDVTTVDGEPQTHFLGGLVGGLLGLVRGLLLTGRLRKTPCPEQICHVPHNVHRRAPATSVHPVYRSQ
ncbi:hypothetical protein SVIOM342S_00967 [Streptomyces violaceorubidus]